MYFPFAKGSLFFNFLLLLLLCPYYSCHAISRPWHVPYFTWSLRGFLYFRKVISLYSYKPDLLYHSRYQCIVILLVYSSFNNPSLRLISQCGSLRVRWHYLLPEIGIYIYIYIIHDVSGVGSTYVFCYVHVHVNGGRLCVWTAASNLHIVHPQMVYEYRGLV
jgi:hypothetical protein